MYVSVPQKSQKDPVSIEELHNRTPLASLGLLHKVGWALGSRSSLPSIVTVNVQCLNELIITFLWLNMTKTIHPLLSQYSSINQGERGTYLRGGANSRICSILHNLTIIETCKRIYTRVALGPITIIRWASQFCSFAYFHLCYTFIPTWKKNWQL